MGGYCFPSFSTLGSQEQRSASATESRTEGTWEPQPHQVVFSVRWISGWGEVRGSRKCVRQVEQTACLHIVAGLGELQVE